MTKPEPDAIYDDRFEGISDDQLDHKKKPLNPDGSEILDPTPMEPPIGYVRAPSLAEQIRAMVISEKLRLETEAAGAESFEEADDFMVDDDFDPTTPYEVDFDPTPVAELRRRQEEAETRPPAPPPKPKKGKSADDDKSSAPVSSGLDPDDQEPPAGGS